MSRRAILTSLIVVLAAPSAGAVAQDSASRRDQRPTLTQKPPLHGRHWMAITGKPLGASAGAMIFQKAAILWLPRRRCSASWRRCGDVLSWGGETQALIYHPKLKKVIAINALGVAPTGATDGVLQVEGPFIPPEYGR